MTKYYIKSKRDKSSGRKRTYDLFFVVNEFPPGPGGVATHAYEIAKGLQNSGFRILVICNQDYADKKTISRFNNHAPLDIISLSRSNLVYAIFKVFLLAKLTLAYKPKVIVSSGAFATLYTTFIERVSRIRQIVFIHGPEYSMSFPAFLTRFILSRSELIAVSKFSRNFFLKNFGLKKEVKVINNGANPARFSNINNIADFREKQGLVGKKVLLTVGRVCERKGQDIVIKSLPEISREVPTVMYLMVGHEEKKEELTELAGKLGIERHIRICGKVKNSELPLYYSASDLYILNSRFASNGDVEGFGISIIEAAFAGKPAIGTKGCGIEEAIEDGETGILVPMDSPEETARTAVTLLTNDKLRLQMGERARQRALINFTWDRAVGQTYDFVNKYVSSAH